MGTTDNYARIALDAIGKNVIPGSAVLQYFAGGTGRERAISLQSGVARGKRCLLPNN